MPLARSFLTLEQVQLLADCNQPVLVSKVPAVAEVLVNRGLLVSSKVTSDYLSCYFLAITGRGRSYVTAWVQRQERAGFLAIGSS